MAQIWHRLTTGGGLLHSLSIPKMSPRKPKRVVRSRQTKRTLKPRQSAAAVRAARPDRAWSVSYRETLPNGGQVYARRFFATKPQAEAFCSEKRAAQASLGNLAGGLTDGIKREALLCVEKLAPYGKSLTDAVAYFIRDLEMQGASKTVADAIAALKADSASRDLSWRHRGMLDSVLDRFAAENGAEVVATVRGEKVQAWLESVRDRNGKALGAVSFNTYRRYLSRLFSFCVRRKWAKENPVQDFDARSVRTRNLRLLSPAALRQILAACDDTLRPALVLQAFCGLRVAEASRAEWDDLLPSGYLQVGADKAKTGKRRLVPVPAPALAYLMRERKPGGLIFTQGNSSNREWALLSRLSEFRKIVPQVKWGKNALRVSAISYHLAVSQDAAKTAEQMGNSASVVKKDYQELATPEAGRDWFAIDPARPQTPVLKMPKAKAGKRKAG